MAKRNYTRELLRARQSGKVVVCSMAPFENWPVKYDQRSPYDPQPWLVKGEWRYSGRECHAADPSEVAETN